MFAGESLLSFSRVWKNKHHNPAEMDAGNACVEAMLFSACYDHRTLQRLKRTRLNFAFIRQYLQRIRSYGKNG
jgi:hypothetical protein